MKYGLLLLILPAMLAGQTIEGDVMNAVTGAPIAGAHVTINGGMTHLATSDAAGHFQLPAASAPYLSLTVLCAGFLRRDRTFLSEPGKTPAAPRIALTPAAVISGKIEDEDGFPVEHAQVQALRYCILNGERKLRAAAGVQTDDLGRFRLTNLAAGHYWIRATAGDAANWDRRYVPEYAPGTQQPNDINRIDIATGQERTGVDIRLTRHEGVTVSGRIDLPAGAAAPAHTMWVNLQEEPTGGLGMFSGMRQRDGSFLIPHVPPGDYILRTHSGNYSPKAGDLLGEQKLRVGAADVGSIVLQMHEVQAVDLEGTVDLEGGGNPPPMRIWLNSMGGGQHSASSNEDGSFVLKGLLPGHYNMQITPDIRVANGAVQPRTGISFPVSARLGEKEVLHAGFDLDGPPGAPLRITVTSRRIAISGKLLDAAGNPVSGNLVALPFAGSTSEGMATADTDGTFSFTMRQAGDYRIYLADDAGNWNDADYMEAHANDFPPLHVVDGTNPPLTLRMAQAH